MSHLISVQLDVLGGLLAELRVLGAELGEEGRVTAATGWSLARALPGPVGDEAQLVGGEWTAALTALTARTLAVAATLESALEAYRSADLALAGQIGGPLGSRALPR